MNLKINLKKKERARRRAENRQFRASKRELHGYIVRQLKRSATATVILDSANLVHADALMSILRANPRLEYSSYQDRKPAPDIFPICEDIFRCKLNGKDYFDAFVYQITERIEEL
jgi:hypothetical protein